MFPKIVEFVFGHSDPLSPPGLIEIGRKIISKSHPVRVLIAKGKDLNSKEFYVDEQHRNIPDLRKNKDASWSNFEMVFQVHGQLADEKENKLLGTYRGKLKHLNHFPKDENQFILDNLIWEDFEKIR